MEEWEIDFKEQILPDEEIIFHITDLEYSFGFVPFDPKYNHPTSLSMRLILTNYRLAARFWDGSVRKWLYISTIQNLLERKISSDKPNWPYQAVLMIGGGLVLTLQTQKVDKTQQEKLSSILNQAFSMFNGRRNDLDEIAAIVRYEQQKRSSQVENSESKK